MANAGQNQARLIGPTGIALFAVAATALILILALATAGDPPSEAQVTSGQVLWGAPGGPGAMGNPALGLGQGRGPQAGLQGGLQGQPVAALPVVFLRPAPAILPNQRPTHGFRGPCPQCHSYVTLNIQPSPWADWSTKPGRTPWLNSTGIAGNANGNLNALPESLTAAGQGPQPTLGMHPQLGAGNRPMVAQVPTSPPQQPGRPTVMDLQGRALVLMPFQEAHWQGIEVVPLTSGLAKVLKIAPNSRGVVLDDATMPADVLGFQAGDLITAIGGVPTPDLDSFIAASEKIRELRQIDVQVTRNNQSMTLNLRSAGARLGTANGETAPMIPAGSIAPHGYRGACTNCHHIGTNGNLAVDPGDLLTLTAPPILASQRTPPHRDRGKCSTCHKIVR